MFRLDFHITLHAPELEAVARLLLDKGDSIMAALDDLRAAQAATATQLETIGTSLTEIATDLDTLIDRLANGQPGSQEVIDATNEAKALQARTAAIADAATAAAGKFTP